MKDDEALELLSGYDAWRNNLLNKDPDTSAEVYIQEQRVKSLAEAATLAADGLMVLANAINPDAPLDPSAVKSELLKIGESLGGNN